MDPILITVKRSDDDREYDLAVQPDLPLSQIVEFISAGLQWKPGEMGFEVKHLQTGLTLDTSKTLAEANVWHGARLEFTPKTDNSNGALGWVWKEID